MCEIVSTNIDSIMISVSIFVVKRSNHELFLERFFQCVARRGSININNELLEMILHSLNKKNK